MYKYIVTQGPLEHTCGDFWQMIWEQQTKIVLMLTNKVVRVRVRGRRQEQRGRRQES